MNVLTSLFLGILQGVTEFLPISSSGHLAIAEHFLGLQGAEIPDFYDVLLHLGTLGAIFAAYWQDIREMVLELVSGVRDLRQNTTPATVPPARRMITLVIIGTLPLIVVLPFRGWIEGLADNIYFVSVALLLTGCLLFLSDRGRRGRKNEKTASVQDVLLVGLAQALATFPGLSRSGTTITAGCMRGFERSFAVRFSFILSIPAVLGANLLTLIDALQAGIIWAEVPMYLLGVAAAALTGYACIYLLKQIAARGRFGLFALYCWVIGGLTLIISVIQALTSLGAAG